jgi:preprotein translocase subunit SecG
MKWMRTVLTAIVVLSTGLCMVGQALAGSDTGTGTVAILEAVVVTNTAGIDFGDILPPTSGNQDFVMAAATGAVTPGGGDGGAFGSPAAASFDVTGTANSAVSVSAVVTTDFASASLTLSALTTNGDTSTIAADGSGTITVGGTLNVASGITANTYNDAVITLTVDYQ